MKRITHLMSNADLLALAMGLLTRVDWAKGIPDDLRLTYERILLGAATQSFCDKTELIENLFRVVQAGGFDGINESSLPVVIQSGNREFEVSACAGGGLRLAMEFEIDCRDFPKMKPSRENKIAIVYITPKPR